MSGTTSTPIFTQDGQYLTFVVGSAAVTLGDVVMLSADGTIAGATTGSTAVIGVVVNGDRISRTATDNQVAVGSYATVLTRGVVNVNVGTGSITYGTLVEAYSTGTVQTHTPGSAAYPAVLGKVLTGGATTAQILLTLV